MFGPTLLPRTLEAAVRDVGSKKPAVRADARFVRITPAGLLESHPHGVTITKDAPNYRRS